MTTIVQYPSSLASPCNIANCRLAALSPFRASATSLQPFKHGKCFHLRNGVFRLFISACSKYIEKSFLSIDIVQICIIINWAKLFENFSGVRESQHGWLQSLFSWQERFLFPASPKDWPPRVLCYSFERLQHISSAWLPNYLFLVLLL